MRYLRLLRERRVLVLWLAELVSVFGDRFFTLALTWMVWQRSGAVALGAVVIAESLPRILIGIFGRSLVAWAASFGVLAWIEAAQVLVIGSLPWLWDRIGLAGVVAVIVVIGVADAVSDPARASLLPDLVRPDQIRNRSAWSRSMPRQSEVRRVGPLVKRWRWSRVGLCDGRRPDRPVEPHTGRWRRSGGRPQVTNEELPAELSSSVCTITALPVLGRTAYKTAYKRS